MTRTRITLITLACALLAFSLAGCGQQPAASDATVVKAESTSATSTDVPTSTVMPTITRPATATATREPTQTQTPSSTPTETPTPTATATSTLTPTLAQIPEDLAEDILSAYKIMLLTQVNSELLTETAIRVQSGELSGIEEAGAIIALGALIKAVDDVLPEYVPPEALAGYWTDVVSVHEQTKDVMRRWVSQEILSSQVVDEMQSVLAFAEEALTTAEAALAENFGFDPVLLAEQRQEVIRMVGEVYEQ